MGGPVGRTLGCALLGLSLVFVVGCPMSPTRFSPASPAAPVSSPSSPAESLVTSYTPPAPTPRTMSGPGMSDGQLSADFTEVAVKTTSRFAHDRGIASSVERIAVGGTACTQHEVLKELVALRKGWTVAGGSSDDEAMATMKAFVEAWDPILPYSNLLSRELGLYALDDGDKLVVHSYVMSWDGGNHGRQQALEVEAYRVSDGSYFELKAEADSFGRPLEKTGPQPVDPKIPRPKDLTR